MIEYKILLDKLIVEIDSIQFNDRVISKVCYWLNNDYIIFRAISTKKNFKLTFKSKKGSSSESLSKLAEKVNTLLNDYKLRDIINEETKDIRNILYVKAFANNDDFEDFNLNED